MASLFHSIENWMNFHFIFAFLFIQLWGILQTFVFVHVLQDNKVSIPDWQTVSEAFTYSTETCIKVSAPKQAISALCKVKDRQLRFKT